MGGRARQLVEERDSVEFGLDLAFLLQCILVSTSKVKQEDGEGGF